MSFTQGFDEDEFALFDRLKASLTQPQDDEHVPEGRDECAHEMTEATSSGTTVCLDCGLEISDPFDQSPEWRYYKENDNKHAADPSRCSLRKYEEKSIYRDVEGFGIPQRVVDMANDSYALITEESILRGNSRKGLIFACIYYAFEDCEQRKSQEEMKALFNINKKILSSGMKMFNLKIKRKPVYTSPLDFIPKIMDKFESPVKHAQFVIKLYHKIKTQSSFINRSNPDSIAAALCYFFSNTSSTPFRWASSVNASGSATLRYTKSPKKFTS